MVHQMQHTNVQCHRPLGSEEEAFLMFLVFFTIYAHGGHLGHVFLHYMRMAAISVMLPGPFEQTVVPPSHGILTTMCYCNI